MLSTLRKVFYHSNLLYSIKIVFSLIGVTFVPWYLGDVVAIIPLTLGVVAAALTDIDGRLLQRFFNLLFTLACFALATFSVQFIIPYTLIFILGLISSTFLFIFMGALGQRYAVISFGSLLIATYTMLGQGIYENNYSFSILLLLGVFWHNIVSLFEFIIQPNRTTTHVLHENFLQLASYLNAKASLFDPDETNGFKNQLVYLAKCNDQLIDSFNKTKRSLFQYLNGYKGSMAIKKMLNYYFIAQDIHEHASSTHIDYQLLSAKFKHSDILFRFSHIIRLQAKACEKISLAIILNQQYHHDTRFSQYFDYINASILHYKNNDRTTDTAISSLYTIYKNLIEIDSFLSSHDKEEQLLTEPIIGQTPFSNQRFNFDDIFLRIKKNMTVKSSLFRHAVRMSLVFLVGFLCIYIFNIPHGYWVMLTSLFVCQPNYSTTKHRLQLRVMGTLLGVIVGLPVTLFISIPELQLLFIIASGWLFFLFKNSQYAYATAFITLLVFMIFNFVGENSLDVAFYRIMSTLLGCAIAWLAVSYIWPDWRYRQLPQLIKQICENDSHYLAIIGKQYLLGKNNNIDYRFARRAVHDSNAELALLITMMKKEPNQPKTIIEQGFRLIMLNYTLISYFSALGSHRNFKISTNTLNFFDHIPVYIITSLHINSIGSDHDKIKTDAINYAKSLTDVQIIDNHDLLVMQQLILILNILPEMIDIITQVMNDYSA